ncbi:hypothetical protein L915_18942, partial [Phytophthora nicotianae]
MSDESLLEWFNDMRKNKSMKLVGVGVEVRAVPLTFSLWPARTSTPAGGEDEGTDENYEEEEEENNGGEAGDEKGDESDSKNVTGETFRPTYLCSGSEAKEE